MSSALFTFHGLFPDEVRQEGQTLVSKVLFDVEYQGKLHAHHMARCLPIWTTCTAHRATASRMAAPRDRT